MRVTPENTIEYDEYLKRKVGVEALTLRIRTRLDTPFLSIAYYPYGLYEQTFALNPDNSDVKLALRDIVPDARIKVERGRIAVTTVDVRLEV